MPAIGAQMRGQYPSVGGLAGLQLSVKHDSAGAIAKQHTGAAVVPVQNSRECLGADHQRALEPACTQEIVRGGKREGKPGTYRLRIEDRTVIESKRFLDLILG